MDGCPITPFPERIDICGCDYEMAHGCAPMTAGRDDRSDWPSPEKSVYRRMVDRGHKLIVSEFMRPPPGERRNLLSLSKIFCYSGVGLSAEFREPVFDRPPWLRRWLACACFVLVLLQKGNNSNQKSILNLEILLVVGCEELVVISPGFALITQRSKVQILPPQLNPTLEGHRKGGLFCLSCGLWVVIHECEIS
jgi:hypothetical protein